MKDTCDKKDCGAPAYVTIAFRTGELHFCEHHGREIVSPVFVEQQRETVVTHEAVPA